MVTTNEMEVAIAKHFGVRSHIIVPNVSWGFFNHELDMFLIRKSGYGFEVEIKRSVSDFRADFNKKHGHVDKKNRIVQLYYAFPEELFHKLEKDVPLDCGIISVATYGNNHMARVRREATRRKGARALTDKEIAKITRLGVMRIWSLKDKLNKLKRK